MILYRDLGHGANWTWQVIDLVDESRDKVRHNSWVCGNGDIHEDKACCKTSRVREKIHLLFKKEIFEFNLKKMVPMNLFTGKE